MAEPGGTLEVLYEDNHLLAVNKPALLPTMGVASDRPSLLTVCRDYVKHKYDKPGNVYLGIVSRLDSPVTGVVLIAKTSKAAARLSEAFRTRAVRKIYLAAVEGEARESAVLEDYLRKDERHRKMHVTQPSTPGAQAAALEYRRLAMRNGLALLAVEPITGRKHQIRVQLSKHGAPIVGDRKYGGSTTFPKGIALHAYRLELAHPVRKDVLRLEAPPPAQWGKHPGVGALLAAFGGTAISAVLD